MIIAPRSIQYTRGPHIVGRDPNLGCETLHSVSRNNLNLHFKFAILIKFDNFGLPFYVLSFTQFCAQKLLLPIVCLFQNLYLITEYFPQNYKLTKCLGGENLELFLGRSNKHLGPLQYTDYACNKKKTHYRRL